ncbi:MAG: GtrA family protein [Desulfatirhabdiaceae bacterium]
MKFNGFKRFSRYLLIGFSTFLFDLTVLWLLISFFSVDYLVAVATGFLIAVSINYCFSRKWVFKGTERKPVSGYLVFLNTALAGSVVTVFLMWVLMVSTGGPVLPIRIIVGILVGMENYLVNLYLNFRVAGNEL